MRANYKMQRLFVPQDLAAGTAFDSSPEQGHYLSNVLRMARSNAAGLSAGQAFGARMPHRPIAPTKHRDAGRRCQNPQPFRVE